MLVAAAGGDEVNGLVAEASRRFVFFADGAVIVTTLVCAVFWALWTFRAAKNVGVLAPGAMSCSPAWSVGLLFLPLANLFMPLRVMFELFANSTSSERGDAYAVAIAWWVLCLLA